MTSLKDLPSNRKMTLIIMLTSSVALLVACGVFAVYDFMTFQRALVEKLSVQAEIIGLNCIVPLRFGDRGEAENTLSALSAAVMRFPCRC